jgi:ATP-dependent DNA helicase RecG
MRDSGYLEHMGMGIPRKIVAGMRAHNGTEPEFVTGHKSLTVRLWRTAPDMPPSGGGGPRTSRSASLRR